MRVDPMTVALSVFRRLPLAVRRMVIRVITPSYVVGTVVVIRNPAGDLLLLRERHHDGWAVPGGLLARREQPADAAAREMREEIALSVQPEELGTPKVLIEPHARRVDVVFELTIDDGQIPRACPPEVLEARWFLLDALPELFEPSRAVLDIAGIPTGHASG